MSRLRLFQPDVRGYDFADQDDDGPEIVPFRPFGDRFRSQAPSLDVLQRSRTIHENRHCPDCHHPVVQPVELRDGLLNRNGMPVPGTATLVGFHCERCDYEWPA